MYEGSFDPDRLKNTNTNAAQTRQNFGHANPLLATGASRQLRMSVHACTKSQGRRPAQSSGTK